MDKQRYTDQKSQIFLAEWNHKRALELIKSAPYRDAGNDPKNTINEPKTAEIKSKNPFNLSYFPRLTRQGNRFKWYVQGK